jgi:hypothetical protein
MQRAVDQLPLRGIGLDPVFGSIRLLNLLTANWPANALCISKEQIEKDILAKHATAIRQSILASRQTWLQIPNWLNSPALPEWVVQGGMAAQ